jgi:hypothetical protein
VASDAGGTGRLSFAEALVSLVSVGVGPDN